MHVWYDKDGWRDYHLPLWLLRMMVVGGSMTLKSFATEKSVRLLNLTIDDDYRSLFTKFLITCLLTCLCVLHLNSFILAVCISLNKKSRRTLTLPVIFDARYITAPRFIIMTTLFC